MQVIFQMRPPVVTFSALHSQIALSPMWKLLCYMYESCILMHMRTTLNIDDELLEKASRLSGIVEKTSLVRRGLEALIARESARRLADLGGTEKILKNVRRRRSAIARDTR